MPISFSGYESGKEHDLTLAREGYAIKKLPTLKINLGIIAILAGTLG